MKAALDPRFLAYGEAVCRQVPHTLLQNHPCWPTV